MKKLRCKKCKYEFYPKKEIIPKKCPYCSEEGTLKEAGHILEEI